MKFMDFADLTDEILKRLGKERDGIPLKEFKDKYFKAYSEEQFLNAIKILEETGYIKVLSKRLYLTYFGMERLLFMDNDETFYAKIKFVLRKGLFALKKLKPVFFMPILLLFSCTPPVHLNKANGKVVVPLKPKGEKVNLEKIHKKLLKKSDKEISAELEEILKIKNGANPSDLKPFSDESIF